MECVHLGEVVATRAYLLCFGFFDWEGFSVPGCVAFVTIGSSVGRA